MRTEHLNEFFKSMGVSWAVRQVAMHVKLHLSFWVSEDGRLHCLTVRCNHNM